MHACIIINYARIAKQYSLYDSIDDFKNMIFERADSIICLHEPMNNQIKGFFIEKITSAEIEGRKVFLAQVISQYTNVCSHG